jgi:hypothetical protein
VEMQNGLMVSIPAPAVRTGVARAD